MENSASFPASALLLAQDESLKPRIQELLPIAERLVASWEPDMTAALIATVGARLERDGISIFGDLSP